MITKALVLLPSRPKCIAGSGFLVPVERVGGLALIQRVLYAARWAGVREGIVWSRDDWPEVERLLREDARTAAFSCLARTAGQEPKAGQQELGALLQEDVLVLFPSWIVDRRALREFCETEGPLEGAVLVEGGRRGAAGGQGLPALALVPQREARGLAEALRTADPEESLARHLRNLEGAETKVLEEPVLIPVENRVDAQQAERILFQSLVKPTESFLSRKFERRVSLAITRLLLDTRITPNQISVFSILMGLASGLFFLGDHRLTHFSGALLLLFSSIVDGCDGEVARLKYQESRLGSLLDFLGDNLVHITVFFCIGLGLYVRGEGSVYLGLGILAALGTFGAAFSVFWRVFLRSGSEIITFSTPVRVEEMDRARGRLRRQIDFADKISNRDFIYVILVLAAAGGLWIYAWLSAFGSVFYLFYLLYLYRRMGLISRASPESGA